MNIRALRWGALIAFIASGGLTGTFVFLSLVWKIQAPILLGLSGALISMAGAIHQLLPAPTVAADANALNNSGTIVGKNVTTTSTEPILAPAPPRADISAHPP